MKKTVIVDELFDRLVGVLSERNMWISAAESCTGGLFAASIVRVPNASRVLSASFVTYSEEAKTKLVEAPEETIARYGVVSEEVAEAMAKGAAKAGHSDVGVGITGFAGPSGGTKEAPVGTVCFGFFVYGDVYTCTQYYCKRERNAIRESAVRLAAESLIEIIMSYPKEYMVHDGQACILDDCPICGVRHFIPVITEKETFEKNGKTCDVIQKHLYCPSADEYYDNGKMLNKNLTAIKAAYEKISGEK